MNKNLIIIMVVLSFALTGCTVSEQSTIQQQQQEKLDQAEKVMEYTKVPQFNQSLERENIRQRLLVSNDPTTLQWIYPMSAGRVFGRFPVKGKVTSGGKRLTSSDMFVDGIDVGDAWGQVSVEAPDEMGTYGSSGEYIFWFDPAGRIHQHRGDYFVSPVPYQIDEGYGTISTEVDSTEEKKVSDYKRQIDKTLKDEEKRVDKIDDNNKTIVEQGVQK